MSSSSSPEPPRHLNRLLKKKNNGGGSNGKRSSSSSSSKGRVLISVNIAGSTGPIRLLANVEDPTTDIIRNVLKAYRHEGRLPVIATNANDHLQLCLYCPNIDRILGSREAVGALGCRNLLLCRVKKTTTMEKEDRSVASSKEIRKESAGNWKSWLNNIIITNSP